jgi:hypothetical protein
MTISNALDSAERILIGLKCPGSSKSENFAARTSLEIFHEAGKQRLEKAKDRGGGTKLSVDH